MTVLGFDRRVTISVAPAEWLALRDAAAASGEPVAAFCQRAALARARQAPADQVAFPVCRIIEGPHVGQVLSAPTVITGNASYAGLGESWTP